MRVAVEAGELARALDNALAFIPARSQVQIARVIIDPQRNVIEAQGTDGYTAGKDTAEMSLCEGLSGPLTLYVAKDELVTLAKAARDGKRHVAVLWVEQTDSEWLLTLTMGEGDDQKAVSVRHCYAEHEATLHEALDELFASRVPSGDVLLGCDYLSRFAKIKADKTDRAADFSMPDDHSPVLVRVGPTFQGLIMPVERQRHRDALGQDGLW